MIRHIPKAEHPTEKAEHPTEKAERPIRKAGQPIRKSGQPTGKAGRLLKNKQGNMVPLAVAVSLGILFIILGVMEYMRLVITAAGIKDATESAIISVVNDNYDEVYHSVREGYAAGYIPDEETFTAAVDHGDVYGRLGFLLGLDEDGDGYVRFNNGGEKEYRISGLQISIPNTPIASAGGTYYADASLKMEIPVRFGGRILTDMTITLKVRAAYKEKF